jgi:hypothetical protein
VPGIRNEVAMTATFAELRLNRDPAMRDARHVPPRGLIKAQCHRPVARTCDNSTRDQTTAAPEPRAGALT